MIIMLLKLFYLGSLCFVIGSAVPVRSCEDGETYWCLSVRTATLCAEFDHCLTNVWPTQKVKTGCVAGEKAVKQIQNQKTESSCNGLSPKYQSRCNDVIKTHSFEIASMTEMKLHPRKMAKLLGLCSTQQVPKVCTDCKAFASDLKQMAIGDKAENELQLYFRTACANFGSFQKPCEEATGNWVKQLFITVKYEMPLGMVCEMLKFCDDGADKVRTNQIALQGAKYFYGLYLDSPTEHGCVQCKMLVTHMKDILLRKDFQQKMTHDAALWCHVIVAMHQVPLCKQIVNDNIHYVFEYLADEISQDYVCESIEMCKASESRPSTMTLLGNRLGKYASSLFDQYQNEIDDIITDLEQKILDEIENLQKMANEVEQKIEEGIDGTMDSLKETMHELQDEFETLKENITSQVENEATNIKSEILDSMDTLEKTVYKFEDDVKGAIKDLYDEGQQTYNDVAEAVEELYNEVKDDVEKIETTVNDFVEKLKNWWNSPTNTQKSTLKMFKGLLNIQLPANNKQTNNADCSMCSMFTMQMLSILEMDKTQQSILENVNEFCDDLPVPVSAQCRHMVDTQGQDLLKQFIESLDSTLVCQALGFCEVVKNHEAPVQPSVEITKPVEGVLPQQGSDDDQSAWCQICHIIVELVQEDIDDIYKSTELSTLSQQVCSMLQEIDGSGRIEDCITKARLIEMAAYEITRELWSPKFACHGIGVCGRPTISTVLKFKPEN